MDNTFCFVTQEQPSLRMEAAMPEVEQKFYIFMPKNLDMGNVAMIYGHGWCDQHTFVCLSCNEQ